MAFCIFWFWRRGGTPSRSFQVMWWISERGTPFSAYISGMPQ